MTEPAFPCDYCENVYDTLYAADLCCVLCNCCGLLFDHWELNENDECEVCAEETE